MADKKERSSKPGLRAATPQKKERFKKPDNRVTTPEKKVRGGKPGTRAATTEPTVRGGKPDGRVTTAEKKERRGKPDARVPDEKLQKVLARAGFGSRRELEEWIAAGRVQINGADAKLGDRVTPSDKIVVDGKKVATQQKEAEGHPVLLYNKPLGEICTRNDPEGRPTVFDNLPHLPHARWVSVGRLDINTTGLLLFTTDGELANRLMHPSTEIEREYAVRVMGEVTQEMLEAMKRGVMLEDGMASFTGIKRAGGEGVNQWYHVVLMEGRNREVRRLWESQGLKVSRLKRVRYGNIIVPSFVRAGKFVELPAADTKALYQAAGMRWKAPSKPLDLKTRYEAKRRGDKRIAPPKDKRSGTATPRPARAEGTVWPSPMKGRR